MNPGDYRALIETALREDLGNEGDITSSAMFGGETSRAVLYSKDSGVLAGAAIFSDVYDFVDKEISVEFSFVDGNILSPGDRVAEIHGRVSSILTGERVALNFLSFLSGIVTQTRRFVNAASSSGKAVILDTRKTIPGFRKLAKYAVTCGGGRNHRMGLYDMILIKDNHIDFAGSVSEAVKRARDRWRDAFKIEVECRTMEEVDEALSSYVDIIMLDNMDESKIRAAVAKRDSFSGKKPQLEVSGNITLENVAAVSSTGVELISSGALTHSVASFDFSLRTDPVS